MMCQSLLPCNKEQDKRKFKLPQGEFRLDAKKNILHQKGYQTLEQAAQRSGGDILNISTNPGDILKAFKPGAYGHGSALELAVLG